MALPDDKAIISIVVDKKIKEELEKYAEILDLSTSKFARNILYVGLDHFSLLRKLGFVHLHLGIERFKKTYNALIDPEEKEDS